MLPRVGDFQQEYTAKASPSMCLFQRFEEQEVNVWPHLFPEDWVQWVKRSTRACYPDRRHRVVYKRKTIQVAREASPRMKSRLRPKRCFMLSCRCLINLLCFPLFFCFSQICSWHFFLVTRLLLVDKHKEHSPFEQCVMGVNKNEWKRSLLVTDCWMRQNSGRHT